MVPATVEVRPATERANVPVRQQGKVETRDNPSALPTVTALAPTTARGLGGALRALFSNRTEEVVPTVVTIAPENGATDVDARTVKELRVTFDIDMDTSGFSWTGGGEMFPKIPDGLTPKWIDKRTCVLPVELEPGKDYRLGINAPSFQNFKSEAGVPIEPLLYRFSTR